MIPRTGVFLFRSRLGTHATLICSTEKGVTMVIHVFFKCTTRFRDSEALSSFVVFCSAETRFVKI